MILRIMSFFVEKLFQFWKIFGILIGSICKFSSLHKHFDRCYILENSAHFK